MNTRNCLIVEDEVSSITLLKTFISKLPFFGETYIATTCAEALSFLNTEPINLIFLDIELPDASGFELLKSFDKLPPTIITSSHLQYAVTSYDFAHAVTDFLLKPFEFERFLKAVNRALSINIGANSLLDLPYLFVKMGRVLKRFNLDDIDYIEAFGIYSKVITKDGAVVVNEIISELEERLPKNRFRRVHKSFIINMSKVNRLDTKNLIISNKGVPLGKTYRKNFESFLSLLDKFNK